MIICTYPFVIACICLLAFLLRLRQQQLFQECDGLRKGERLHTEFPKTKVS